MNATALEHEIRERYARAAWTQKTHEKDADIYHARHNRLKWCKIILSVGAASGGILSVLLEKWWAVVSALLASATMLVNLIFENRDYETLSNKHRNMATTLLKIREDFLSLISELHMPDCDLTEIRKRKDEILNNWCEVLANAPRTSSKAYNAATNALHNDELNFNDEEIDHILPPAFRICKEITNEH